MPLLRINATAAGLILHETGGPAGERLRSLKKATGPTIIMVHGYKYQPGHVKHCPHNKIFGLANQAWPRTLGFGAGHTDEGLGIAFGWSARGSLRRMHRRATELGTHLARLVRLLRRQRPTSPVHVIAHSMGVEAALNCLAHLPEGAIDRMVLLSGASYRSKALEMLKTEAGRSAEFLNITSTENDLFDAAFEHLVPRPVTGDRAIGTGLAASNVATLRINCADTLDSLGAFGFHIASPERRICHWSSYQRPGVMEFYRRFLRDADNMPLVKLQQIGATGTTGCSRLITNATDPMSDNVIALPYPARPLDWLRRLSGSAAAREKRHEHAY